jgi:hypothetical protein
MAQTDARPGFRLPWTAEHGNASQTNEAPPPEAAAGDEATPAQEPVTPDMTDATATFTAPAARRPTRFMAELSHAMQVAAQTSRDETLARVGADLKVVVEEIHAASTLEAADLRRRADDDVAAVREWSKTEIARIRDEAEARISLRKTALDSEMEAHTAVVATRVERVGATVAEFEARMAEFFKRLGAEEDPTRIATMAETMPDPPDLTGIAASVAGAAPEPFDPARPAIGETEAVVEVPSGADPITPSEPDFAAAEAEAATFTGDLEDDDDGPESIQVEDDEADGAAPAAIADESSLPAERTTTRVVVLGLVSVASIATFKRGLGRAAGVSTIGVASGPDDEFVFTVSHDSGIALGDAIKNLPGFEAQVTEQAAGSLQVTAHDPDTGA